MKYLLGILISLVLVITPAYALEIEAPIVPESGKNWMPANTDSLSDGLYELVRKAVFALRPDLQEAVHTGAGVLVSVLILSIMKSISTGTKQVANITGTFCIASLLLSNTDSMIGLASDTVVQISEYGKLLLPVMTAALAAQGGITASGTLYAGTAMFIAILNECISKILVPGVYFILALYIGNCATGEDMLKRIGDMAKGMMCWALKTSLIVFTSYLGLTGVVSGTTDAAALKTAKVTISSVVPVVGGILSDASEAVLVSAGLMKNAAGAYGILAILSLFLEPFLHISVHYLILKLTASLCSILGEGKLPVLIEGFASALGILLGMTGAVCITLLIGTVCFMKGVG